MNSLVYVISGLLFISCGHDVIIEKDDICPVSPGEVIECAKAFERVRAQVVILEAKVAHLEADLQTTEYQLAVCDDDLSIFDGLFIVCKNDHNKCVDLNGMKKMIERGAEVGRCNG